MRGDGRVFERGHRWFIQYYFRGKPVREPGGLDGRGAKSEAEARKRLKARLKEIYGDRFIGPQAERVTVDEILDSYSAHLKQKGAKSAPGMDSKLKAVRDHFRFMRAVDITTDQLRTFINSRLAEGKAPATCNRSVQYLRAAFRLAQKEGKILRLPYFPTLRENNVRTGFFERHEIETIVAHLPKTIDDIVRFGYCSGWRRGEILSLRWEDVDRDAGEVRLRAEASKTGEGRCLPLEIGELRDVIERRWAAREYSLPDGTSGLSAVVFHRQGRPVKDFKRVWAAACTAAKVPGRLFHDLRRSAVRDMIRAGVPQAVAQRISGHKTASIFNRYNITSDTDKREALRKLEAYRASRPVPASNVVAMSRPS
ncbi:MAG: tyrosine-type recombinase/integrase [Acidobacteriia bacterium]|nr:tyrosine-type recombinase/integrase [Terriglobia bacterium]